MNNIISLLQNKRLVWKANRTSLRSTKYIQTGFSEIDKALDGGWPQVGVIALQSLLGVGELRLFMPGLKRQGQQNNRLIVFISPPWPMNAEMLYEQGFNLQNIMIIQSEDHNSQLWGAEQCLRSGCCDAVLIWQRKLQVHQVKRLQLAAQQGGALNIVFSDKHVYQGLPFSLSLEASPIPQGIKVKINKRIGAWPLDSFEVSMQKHWPQLTKQDKSDYVLTPPLRNVNS
jgi:hypothetical protein